jgi:hypothetical protein
LTEETLVNAFKSWRLDMAAATPAVAGLLAHAEDKLIDGFGVEQLLDSGFVSGTAILASSRELLARSPPDPGAMRVNDAPRRRSTHAADGGAL